MNGISLTSLAVYCLQVLVVIGTGALASRGLAEHTPALRLAYWRALLAVCVLLPLVPAPTGTPVGDVNVVAYQTIATLSASRAAHSAWPFVIGILLAGAIVRGAWLGSGLWRLRRLRRESVAASVDAAVLECARAVASHVDLRTHPAVSQPVSFGWRHPVVLLPPCLRSLAPDVQRAALLHECVHVARRDWIGLVAEQAVQAVLWFHPAIWWATGQAQLAREQVVDAAVVRMLGTRKPYAEALLSFADIHPLALAAPLFARRHMARRIAALDRPRSVSMVRLLASAVCLFALTAAVTLSAASAVAQQTDNGAVYHAGNGVSLPTVVREVRPQYTRDAMDARIEGHLLLSCVVQTNGVPSDIFVSESLDSEHGLDDAAVDALRQWRFKPGTKDGKPVAVQIAVDMRFTLK